jgi:calcineurin-like phosphoesterase family protein
MRMNGVGVGSGGLRSQVRPGALAAVLGMVVAATVAHAADEIHWTVMGPGAVSFDWRGGGTDDTLRYWAASGGETRTVVGKAPNPTPDSSPGPFREARITGLGEDALYRYRIGNGDEHTFRTPPRRGRSDFWFAEEADIGSSRHWKTVATTQEMIATDHPDLPGDDRPRFVLVPGDLSYGDQDAPADVDQHFNDVMAWSQDAAYMPAWGNHEWGEVGEKARDGLQNYEGRFDLPNSQTSPGADKAAGNGPGEDWYWFDYGNVRFIAFPEPYSGAWSDWAARAEPVMAAAQRDHAISFIVTFGHRPSWSSGADHEGDASLAKRMAALHARHPKYVLSIQAHSHHYERSDPDRTDGILFVVGGGGGSTVGGLNRNAPAWSAFRMNRFQHLRIHVQSDRIDGYAICGPPSPGADACVQGTVIDSWTVMARAASSPAPAGVLQGQNDAGDPPAPASPRSR